MIWTLHSPHRLHGASRAQAQRASSNSFGATRHHLTQSAMQQQKLFLFSLWRSVTALACAKRREMSCTRSSLGARTLTSAIGNSYADPVPTPKLHTFPATPGPLRHPSLRRSTTSSFGSIIISSARSSSSGSCSASCSKLLHFQPAFSAYATITIAAATAATPAASAGRRRMLMGPAAATRPLGIDAGIYYYDELKQERDQEEGDDGDDVIAEEEEEEGTFSGGGGSSGRNPGSGVRRRSPVYAVAVGRQTGVFHSWGEVDRAVKGYSGAIYKKFSTEAAARVFVQARAAAVKGDHGAAAAPAAGGDASSSGAAAAVGSSIGGGSAPLAPPLHLLVPPGPPAEPVGPFYAVGRGHKSGIYQSWAEAHAAVRGASGASFKRFNTRREAESFLEQYGTMVAMTQPTQKKGKQGDGVTDAAAGGTAAAAPSDSPCDNTGAVHRAPKRPRGRPKKALQLSLSGAPPASSVADATAAAATAATAAVAAAATTTTAATTTGGTMSASWLLPSGTADCGSGGVIGGGGGDATPDRNEEAPVEAPVAGGEAAGAGAVVPYDPTSTSNPAAYYAVARGKQVGIFTSWSEARTAVEGASGARFRKFRKLPEAYSYLALATSQTPGQPLLHAAARERIAGALPPPPPPPPPPSRTPSHKPSTSATSQSSSASAEAAGSSTITTGSSSNIDQEVALAVDAARRTAASNVTGNVGGGSAGEGDVSGGGSGGGGGHVILNGRKPEAQYERVLEGEEDVVLDFSSLTDVVDPNRTYRLEFDGGSRRNPGDAGFGAVLVDEATGRHVEYVAGPLVRSSNNVAEWTALAAGMKVAMDMGVRHLVVQGDSELVCRQVSGRYGVNTPALQPLAALVFRLKEGLTSFEVKHVPRSENAAADLLSNFAMDAEEAVAAAVAAVEGEQSEGEEGGDEELPGVWQQLQPIVQELGQPALQAARTAVAAAAASSDGLSETVLLNTTVAASDTPKAAAKASSSSSSATTYTIRQDADASAREGGRVRGYQRKRVVVLVEAERASDPLAVRGSVVGSFEEFQRVLIALSCAAHGLLPPPPPAELSGDGGAAV